MGGQWYRGHESHNEDLALTPSEVGAWEGPEQRLGGMSQSPSGCSQGSRLCGTRQKWGGSYCSSPDVVSRAGEKWPGPGQMEKEAWLALPDTECETMLEPGPDAHTHVLKR